MHSFSVDFLTGVSVKEEFRSTSPSQLSGSDGLRTPSPNSTISTPSSSPQTSVNDPDVAKALQALERQAARKPAAGPEKPPLSYIAMISMAILSSQEKRLLLSDIYQWIMDNFEYYNNSEKAWRNSIRHNLSLNECFIKNGRSDNGKGHFWAIHPACLEDFSRGDYRRRQARRRAKRNDRENSSPVQMPYMAAPTMRFAPYALPMQMAAAAAYSYMPYYASPMLTTSGFQAAMSAGLPPITTMSPLSPTGYSSYPSFPLSPAMMTPFPVGQHSFPLSQTAYKPW